MRVINAEKCDNLIKENKWFVELKEDLENKHTNTKFRY